MHHQVGGEGDGVKTEPTSEQLALARKIVGGLVEGNNGSPINAAEANKYYAGVRDNHLPMQAALVAIIETTERAAKYVGRNPWHDASEHEDALYNGRHLDGEQ